MDSVSCVAWPVWAARSPPFRYAGTIERVVFDVSGDLVQHDEAEMRRLMAEQ